MGIPDMELPGVDELVEKKLLLGVLADAMDSLLPEERELAIKVFGEEMNVYEYAKQRGVLKSLPEQVFNVKDCIF